jgi:hypothetical protein
MVEKLPGGQHDAVFLQQSPPFRSAINLAMMLPQIDVMPHRIQIRCPKNLVF